MTVELVVAIIVAILGSGGISALISTLITAKKTNAESDKIDAESECLINEEKRADIDFISSRLHEISQAQNEDSTKLRQRNDELSRQIDELNNKLQALMEWIIYDNHKYVSWLEARLKEHDPEIEFPECSPPPKIFNTTEDSSTK